ncbi:hypothetical protein VMCG_09930 [Cytospora schulzeri]|uniref:Fungal N-terminal domain-containing protein n=1 Tax=Cytospora schulzeri TaxID=448051 RepID=A0A423VF07_9PEZI|nr:hypothetical protein VMCG_09930 [Valsa malicola]
MHDNRTHPLLAQVPLTVSPFVNLPTSTTLPYTYKPMPSTLPPSITGITTTTSASGDPESSGADKARYVISQSGHAAHPDDIIASCRALQAHLSKLQADAEQELRALDERIRERELAEKRRVAPGWLDSEARLLEPERAGGAGAGSGSNGNGDASGNGNGNGMDLMSGDVGEGASVSEQLMGLSLGGQGVVEMAAPDDQGADILYRNSGSALPALTRILDWFTTPEFSWEVVAGAREIYKSADGTSANNAHIRKIASNLQGLTENLGTGALGGSKPESDLRRLATDCNALSTELKTILQKLQSTGGIRNAMKVKWRTIRKKDEISSTRGRLAEYTSQITLAIDTLLLDQQSGIKSQLDSMQSVESQSATTTIQELKDIRKSLRTLLQTAMITQQDISGLRGQAQTGIDIISQHAAILSRIRLSLDSLKDLMQVIPVEKRILRYIFHKSMFDREEAIHDAEDGTCSWLLEGQDNSSSDEGEDWSATEEASSAERGSDRMINSKSNGKLSTGQGNNVDEDAGNPAEGDPCGNRLSQFKNNQRKERRIATGKLIAWLQDGSGVFHLDP